ncbi:RES family NAD+ phosphorylase [Spirosoma horti]
MRLYRFSPTAFANDLSGTGGLYSAGRWNRKGTRILYTSDCVSLAKLELLANSTTLPDNLMLVTLEVPEDATCFNVPLGTLPTNWRAIPYRSELAVIAEQWQKAMAYWLLQVPSVHSPTEFNYLLNPLHPEHKTLKLISVEPHSFDPRLK